MNFGYYEYTYIILEKYYQPNYGICDLYILWVYFISLVPLQVELSHEEWT